MNRYMLDTNIVSHLIRLNPVTCRRAAQVPMEHLCISVITEGELMYGLAKEPHIKKLSALVEEFLSRVVVLPWTSSTARRYGIFRANADRQGIRLGPLDMLIAAHAFEAKATLVTNDRAFSHLNNLTLEDWTLP